MLISVIFATVNVFFLIKRFNLGVAIFFIGCLLCPHFMIFNLIVSYEICLALPVLITFLFKERGKRIHFSAVFLLLGCYIFLNLIATITSINKYGVSISWISLIGTIRIVVLMFLLTQLVKKDEYLIENILYPVILINLILVFIQIFISSSSYIFSKLYVKESLNVLLQYSDMGHFDRATGSFGSPVNLGVFSLFCFAFWWGKILEKSGTFTKEWVGLITSLICGMASLTKTFTLGSPLILFIGLGMCLIVNVRSRIRLSRTIIKSCLLLILIGIIYFSFVPLLESRGFPISRYLNYWNKPLESFSSRYDPNRGILSLTVEVINQNILLGVGNTNPLNEFLGDSTYVVLMHDTGILGVIVFILIVLVLILALINFFNLSKALVGLSLVFAGLGLPVLFSIFGVLGIAYLHPTANLSVRIVQNTLNKKEYVL